MTHVQVGHSLATGVDVRHSRELILPGDSEVLPQILTFLVRSVSKEIADAFESEVNTNLGLAVPLSFKDVNYYGYVREGWTITPSHHKKRRRIETTTIVDNVPVVTITYTDPLPLFDISFEFFGFRELPTLVWPAGLEL